ncbi:MAG: DUF1003 domain-containing protein [Candidatus Aenigmarchaeota archaeon]|nr:DUF1003 domain-containing protein [Candidatus Aenigmarchaeota archaeon]
MAVPKQQDLVTCHICGKPKKLGEVVPAELVRDSLAEIIKVGYPTWSQGSFVCVTDLNRFRAEYVEHILEKEKGEISSLESEVLDSFKEQDLLAKNINLEFQQRLTLGDRLADKITEFAGSWKFIILFFLSLLVWVITNTVLLVQKPLDPYPFLLLNIVLSCIAAIQAPVIMMSQNRQEKKYRLQSDHDYQVNLKAELEIRHINAKIDRLLTRQWQRLLEIQKIQMELVEDLVRKPNQPKIAPSPATQQTQNGQTPQSGQ